MRWLIILVFLLSQISRAGFQQIEAGSRPKALGGAYAAAGGDAWTMFFNVAGLSRLDRNEVSFFYSPSPFGLPELGLEAAAFGFRSNFGVIGLAARRFGFELYRELSATLSYASSVSTIGFGLSLNRHSVAISRYGSASVIGVDAGLLAGLSGRLACGLSVKNLNAPKIGVSREPLPQVFTIGFEYVPAGGVTLAGDYRKESGRAAATRFGFEYRIVSALALRAGFSDAETRTTGGVGIQYMSFRLDYAFESHQELGWTHEFTFSIRWGAVGGTP